MAWYGVDWYPVPGLQLLCAVWYSTRTVVCCEECEEERRDAMEGAGEHIFSLLGT